MRCDDALSHADLTFNFTMTYRTPALTGNHYSSYQLFLYQTISEYREQGMTFNAVAEGFNKKGYLTVRGRRFRGAHVHSILKRMRSFFLQELLVLLSYYYYLVLGLKKN